MFDEQSTRAKDYKLNSSNKKKKIQVGWSHDIRISSNKTQSVIRNISDNSFNINIKNFLLSYALDVLFVITQNISHKLLMWLPCFGIVYQGDSLHCEVKMLIKMAESIMNWSPLREFFNNLFLDSETIWRSPGSMLCHGLTGFREYLHVHARICPYAVAESFFKNCKILIITKLLQLYIFWQVFFQFLWDYNKHKS